MTATIRGPLNLTVPAQEAGIWLGFDQDNYVKLVTQNYFRPEPGTGPRIEMFRDYEPSGLHGESSRAQFDKNLTLGASDTLTLVLEAQSPTTPGAGAGREVRGRYWINNGAPIEMPVNVLHSLNESVAPGGPTIKAGILANSHIDPQNLRDPAIPNNAPPFTVAFDSFAIAPVSPPAVTSITPGGDVTGVNVNSNITVTFSEPMDPRTTGALILATTAGAPVPATVTANAAGTVWTLNPTRPLASGEYFRVTVRAPVLTLPPFGSQGTTAGAALDRQGDSLGAPVSTTFTAAGALAPICGRFTPAAKPKSGKKSAKAKLTLSQIAINQRIYSAAIRRADAVEKWLNAGIQERDLCGGGLDPGSFGEGVTFAPATRRAGDLTPPSPRPIVLARASKKKGTFRISRAQLLTNDRIAQGALRRATALEARLRRLTGGDVVDGSITEGKLASNVALLSAGAGAPTAPSRTVVGKPGRQAKISLSATQLSRSQATGVRAIEKLNAIQARLRAGLTSDNFAAGSLSAADLNPTLRR